MEDVLDQQPGFFSSLHNQEICISIMAKKVSHYVSHPCSLSAEICETSQEFNAVIDSVYGCGKVLD